MASSAEEFLETAKASLELKSECDSRNATSRAYYAMYHVVSSLVTQAIPHYSTGGVHHRLIQHLLSPSNGEPFDKNKQRRLAYMLKQGKELRSQADYDISQDFELVRAQDQVKRAEMVISICQELASAA